MDPPSSPRPSGKLERGWMGVVVGNRELGGSGVGGYPLSAAGELRRGWL